MKTLSVCEMRQGHRPLRKALEEEGEVILTYRGKPFARVLPLEPVMPPRRIGSLKWLRDQMPFQPVPSEVSIREDRDARD